MKISYYIDFLVLFLFLMFRRNCFWIKIINMNNQKEKYRNCWKKLIWIIWHNIKKSTVPRKFLGRNRNRNWNRIFLTLLTGIGTGTAVPVPVPVNFWNRRALLMGVHYRKVLLYTNPRLRCVKKMTIDCDYWGKGAMLTSTPLFYPGRRITKKSTFVPIKSAYFQHFKKCFKE
jgi:hypothetical protein